MNNYIARNGNHKSRKQEHLDFDSSILTKSNHVRALRDFLSEDEIPSGLKLLYRGSTQRNTQDGMNAATFHQKCDNMGSTVTVVKNIEGYIFGGYADKSWKQSGQSIHSDKSFLFGLHCHDVKPPTKLRVKEDKNIDLLFLNSNFINIGTTYALSGNETFTPEEVEIFQVTQNPHQQSLSPRDWDNTQVVAWVKNKKRLSSDVSEYFSNITGGELLAMGREDIKDLGIRNPGTVALLVENIQKLLEEDNKMSAPLIEHSKYCFG